MAPDLAMPNDHTLTLPTFPTLALPFLAIPVLAIGFPSIAAALGVVLLASPSAPSHSALLAATLAPALVLRACVFIARGRRAAGASGQSDRLNPSPLEWARRLETNAFATGLSRTFVPSWSDASARGAGLAWAAHRVSSSRIGAFLAGRAVGSALWAAAVVTVLALAQSLLARQIQDPRARPALILSFVLFLFLAKTVPLLLTHASRQHLHAVVGRILHHEYWPAWAFYAPLIPYTLYLALKHRGYTLPTCVNPAIENGGGWVGESKHAILAHFLRAGLVTTPGSPTPGILPTFLIPADEDAPRRAALAQDIMRRERLTFPIVLKPDQAQRGHAFKVARRDSDLDDYFRSMTTDAILQVYHNGPHECGILWVRHARPTTTASAGFNYSITRKEFPVLEGDGTRTLEQLIHDHPRFRKQAAVFLDRFAGELTRVPSRGERLHLAASGNHCQGTLFKDGSDLDSPALLAAIERLALAFPDLDYGRFDIRYERDDLLRDGRHFAVVELNGATSEPTSMYDPSRSPLFAYRVLFGLWARIYELGALRRDAGVRPISLGRVIQLARAHARERTGSALAD